MISSMRGGGSEQQTLLLLQHLDRTKFSPHLYLTHREGDLLDRIPDDVVIHEFQPSPAKFYFPGRALRDQVDHLQTLIQSEQIDVIYDRTFHMTMIAGPAASAAGVPRISTIVSPPDRALPLVERRFVGIKKRRLAKAYRQSARVIAVSRNAAESAARYYGLKANQIDVVPNPVDRNSIIERAKTKIDRPDGVTVLACVGRMTQEKGHSDLIEALRLTESDWSHAPLHVWMVGDGPLLESLNTKSEQTLKLHHAEFVGHQPDAAPWIGSADGLVLPSRFEGMPNVVLEAMALGIPVVATAAGGTPELQGNPPTMFMAESADPSSLALQLRRFAAEQPSRINQVQAATEMIQRDHNVEKAVRKIESILAGSVELAPTMD
ncbi:glycosyltransferase [Rubripirellula obstinata]|nr:glycosyltransferase [Rubripirellula obstinata]